MVQIGICDDDKDMVFRQEDMVKKTLTYMGVGCRIITYTKSSNLLWDISEDGFFFDLILLDIEMPERSGMEIAEKIKPCLPNVKIIFITSHLEYAIDAFELSVFRYVPKNDMEKRLRSAVCDAVKLIGLEEGQVYCIRTNSRMEKIPCREILYIQREGKNASIVSEHGISTVRKSLQQVFEELSAEEFIYIDRGCIVNIIHIMQIKEGMAVLKNGVSLPVSRSHLQEVKERINTYWGRHI